MKFKFPLSCYLVFFATALLSFLGLSVWQKHPTASKSVILPHPASWLPPCDEHEISELVSSKKRNPILSLNSVPAPLYEPSEKELRRYPGAFVLEAVAGEGPEPHQEIHTRILKTDFKSSSNISGLIRTEEIVNNQTGELVSRKEMIADHLLVSLPADVDPYYFLKRLGTIASAINKITQDDSLYDVTLRSGSLEAIPQGLEKIALGKGAYAEPDLMLHACGQATAHIGSYNYTSSSGEDYPISWQLRNQWGLLGSDKGGIDILDAWSKQPGSPTVIVAVIDSGIRYTHDDLVDNIWNDPSKLREGNLHGIDMIDSKDNSMDLGKSGHGTHVAGIIGGMGSNGKPFGVSYNIQLMACRFLDGDCTGSERDLITCMDYAIRHGATILNCSVAMEKGSYSSLLFNFLQEAHDKGVIVVAAAGDADEVKETDSHGNSITKMVQNNNDDHPIYPASYPLDNIISVAASNTEKTTLSPDSNYGAKTVHIIAPGSDIYSTWNQSDYSYTQYSGTSMAAPFVSGSLALLQEHYPHASPQALIQHLLNNADKDLSLQGKIIQGRHLNIGKALKVSLQ
ncbi:MAG: S8 family peptidase [Chthoniobacterales bacterium]